jgi:hypothetical protein
MLTKDDIIQKIKDDLYLTGKQTIMDNLPENQRPKPLPSNTILTKQ